MSVRPSRILGVAACGVAIAVAWEARTFRVAFYTDPLGPGGLPLLAAALIGVGGLVAAVRPDQSGAWPDVAVARRVAWGVLVLLAYAAALPHLGFVITTAAVVTALAVIFGGPVRRSAMLALAYTAALYLLFAVVLGLGLPVGGLFVRGP